MCEQNAVPLHKGSAAHGEQACLKLKYPCSIRMPMQLPKINLIALES